MKQQKAYLHLENGNTLNGYAFGYWGSEGEPSNSIMGECVFNTSMVGYQEIFSDPSYCQQIVTLTYPLVGNYSVSPKSMQSNRAWVQGVVIKEYFQSDDPLFENVDHMLKTYEVPGLSGVDTRMLTRQIRKAGVLKGELSLSSLPSRRDWSQLNFEKHVDQVSTKSSYHIPGSGHRVALIDFGVKQGIIQQLQKHNCAVDVFSYDTRFEDISKIKPSGVLLSNGPGDPEEIRFQIPLIQKLQEQYPLFGICLGHQLFCMANDCNTEKMKLGHRGGNHPVKDLETESCFLTSQNHGYHVTEKNIESSNLKLTHINLNDQSVEGVKHKHLPAFSVQFHPEAQPGPEDSQYLFNRFINMMESK